MLDWARMWLVALGAVVAGCGGRARDPGPRCTAGQEQECLCVNGDQGAQRCSAEGSFDACSCGNQSGGSGAEGGSAGLSNEGRRLPLPCQAPLPTGFCFVNDELDVVGGGRESRGSGVNSVRMEPLDFDHGTEVDLSLWNALERVEWSAYFSGPVGKRLRPGLYEALGEDSEAALSIRGSMSDCSQFVGRFAFEELKRPFNIAGVDALSVTFEQRCEGRPGALRGVINLDATGEPDWTITPRQTITLQGEVFKVIYDPVHHVGYGLDAAHRTLAKIDLASETVEYVEVVPAPNDACLDAKRQRLFVVSKGSSVLTEYDANDLSWVRDIAWSGVDSQPDATHFEIHCAPDRIYVVDGAERPGLTTVDSLDDAQPVVVDHSAELAGIGGLAVNAAGTDLYYWFQDGWGGGASSTSVRRVETMDLGEVGATSGAGDFSRNPLDTPLLLDESRGLVITKNRVFDANDLRRIIASIPSSFIPEEGAYENVYALDPARGRMVTKSYIYDLDQFKIVSWAMVLGAEQVLFDASGAIWYLSRGVLSKQVLDRGALDGR